RILREVLVLLAARVGALRVERVAERRLVRLVVRRQRPVLEPLGDVEPGAAVRLHDERVVAGDGVLGLGAVGRHVARLLVLLEVGYVEARPLALAAVPPDVALALGPRVAVRIGGGAVVDDPAVRRPGPRPFGRDVALLLPVWLLSRGLVDPVRYAAAVDQAAAQRLAFVLQLGIACVELAAR